MSLLADRWPRGPRWGPAMRTSPIPPSPALPKAGDPSDAEINRRVLEKVRRMTADEVFQLSVACGVHRPDGRLTPEYGGPPSDTFHAQDDRP